MSNKVECQEIEKWSELAVNAVSELIKASTTIRFERCEAAPSDDRNYGELTFDLENGVVDAAETLIFINQGLRKTETEFFRGKFIIWFIFLIHNNVMWLICI